MAQEANPPDTVVTRLPVVFDFKLDDDGDLVISWKWKIIIKPEKSIWLQRKDSVGNWSTIFYEPPRIYGLGERLKFTDANYLEGSVTRYRLVIGNEKLTAISKTQLFNGNSEHREQLFITPTGYNLKNGEIRFQNKMLLYNEVAIGVSDQISMNIGGLFVPTEGLPLFQASLKVATNQLGGIGTKLNGNFGGTLSFLVVDRHPGTFGSMFLTGGNSWFDINCYLGYILPIKGVMDGTKVIGLGSNVFFDKEWGAFFEYLAPLNLRDDGRDWKLNFTQLGLTKSNSKSKVSFGIVFIQSSEEDGPVFFPLLSVARYFNLKNGR